jgi:hypothetical protein
MPTLGEYTTTQLINSYLKVMQKSVTKQFNDEVLLYNMVEKKSGKEIAGGRQVELPHHVFPNRNIGGVRGDAGAWAKASVGKRANALVPVYPHNTTGSFGKIAEMKTKADVQSIQSVVEAMVEDIKIGFPQQINKLLYLDGRGVLAKVESITAATLKFIVFAEFAATATSEFGIRYLEEGTWITNTTDDSLADPDGTMDAQIIDVNTATREYTVEGAYGNLAVDDYIVLQDGLNNVTEGLLSGISDGTTAPVFGGATYLNILRTGAGNGYWKSNETDMGGTGVIEDNIILTMTTAQKRSGKATPNAVTTFEVYNQIFFDSKSSQARQFVVNVGKGGENRKYGLGFDAIDIATQHGMLTIFGDKDCPLELMFGFDPKDFKFAQVGEQGWFKTPDGSMFHEIGGTYGQEVNWLWVFNFICTRPQAQWKLSDIPVT